MLKQISNTLTEHIRETDLLARLGGDEFAIIMNDSGQKVKRKISGPLTVEIKERRRLVFCH